MIKFGVLLLVLFIGLLFGHNLVGVEGRIIIALPETVIELSVISTLIIAFFAVLLFWLLEWLFKRLYNLVAGSKNWLGAFSKRQQRKAFYQSIMAMLINDNARATTLIEKTKGGDFHGCNALIGAELAMQQGKLDQAQAYLIDAADEPSTKAIALMKQAKLALDKGQATDAMDIISTIEGKSRQSRYFVQLKLNILASLQDWPQIKTFAASNKKLLGDEYVHWAGQCVNGEFAAIASKHGAKALQEHWENSPRAIKSDSANQFAYIGLLIDAGMHQQAETELLKYSNKGLQTAFYPLVKRLKLPHSSALERKVESEIKKAPSNHALFSVLAHLAYNANNLELAYKAVTKSLELHDNKDDKFLLANILERGQDYEGANGIYKALSY